MCAGLARRNSAGAAVCILLVLCASIAQHVKDVRELSVYAGCIWMSVNEDSQALEHVASTKGDSYKISKWDVWTWIDGTAGEPECEPISDVVSVSSVDLKLELYLPSICTKGIFGSYVAKGHWLIGGQLYVFVLAHQAPNVPLGIIFGKWREQTKIPIDLQHPS